MRLAAVVLWPLSTPPFFSFHFPLPHPTQIPFFPEDPTIEYPPSVFKYRCSLSSPFPQHPYGFPFFTSPPSSISLGPLARFCSFVDEVASRTRCLSSSRPLSVSLLTLPFLKLCLSSRFFPPFRKNRIQIFMELLTLLPPFLSFCCPPLPRSFFHAKTAPITSLSRLPEFRMVPTFGPPC